MIQKFEKISNVKGELELPGDKSISHRAVMFASMADGVSIVHNCSNSEDVQSTINCFADLGVKYERTGNTIKIYGKGFKGFKPPTKDLYAGNSGTTARLMSGILCAQDFHSTLAGDESLSMRPMQRIVEPLRLMGADISPSNRGTLPIVIKSSNKLKPISYKLHVASAQVKSALIFAALHLKEVSIITELVPTRNHTEKMLGLQTESSAEGTKIYASKNKYPQAFELTVPSDISTASFFIVLTLVSKKSELIIKNVSLNETRIGLLNVLKDMGGIIIVENEIEERGEKRGDIRILSSELKNIEIPRELIPNIIDEIPILSVAGLFAEGTFRIKHAKELRVKESDRIKALCNNFLKMRLQVVEYDDGFELNGSIKTSPITFESYGDHRIAMTFAVMSMLTKNGGSVKDFECVGVSNPQFIEQIRNLCYSSKI